MQSSFHGRRMCILPLSLSLACSSKSIDPAAKSLHRRSKLVGPIPLSLGTTHCPFYLCPPPLSLNCFSDGSDGDEQSWEDVPSGRETGLDWVKFGEFPWLVGYTVGCYCPGKMVEHPKSMSAKPSPRPDGTPCNLKGSITPTLSLTFLSLFFLASNCQFLSQTDFSLKVGLQGHGSSRWMRWQKVGGGEMQHLVSLLDNLHEITGKG